MDRPRRGRRQVVVNAQPGPPGRGLVADVLQAWAACERARDYFNSVTEAELVDEAILRLAAAERRYAYLLRLARAEGLRVPAAGARG